MSIFDFFTREAGQERRRALEGLLTQFIPPEMRPQLGLLAEANPVVSMERAGQDAQTLFAPDQSLMDRLAAGGRMASNMAGVVAPAMVAGRAGVPVANAVQEVLTGYAPAVQPFLVDEFGGVGVPSFRAFHGSPHDFDRFDMSKIGTGEGAQAYGHGLYFAANEGVANSYRAGLSGSYKTTPEVRRALDELDNLGFSTPREAAEAVFQTPNWRTAWDVQDGVAAQIVDDWLKNRPGRMYEVQINADPNDFLDWDKPLSEQPQVLQRLGMSARPEQDIHDEALRLMTEGNAREPGKMWFDYPELQARIDELQGELDRRAPNMSGQEFYRGGADGDVSNILSQMGYGNPEVQTQALREAGIPGIRYLDAGSRGAGDGSRNYVVFDDKLIDIVRKYGIAGAAAMLGVSALDVEQAMAQGQQQPQGLLSGAQ